ncbi:HAD hydrolase-like protein [Acidisoma cellulosilytica]|uniref:phosphoglycolate phosphatase n=1 Tax=Acidisoma cellulosilyticum TaxID=2802395 RepID=A0A963Z511_9PROT|nr:HAD hydrolase-like protein [Acidisoma cellulosilyticum]MCB8882596.1 HAD hydrolase-like protein [Acidisoma cellulosilyticum]
MPPILVEHVIFDLDGTLVDTRKAVEECYRYVFTTVLRQTFPPSSIDAHVLYAMRPLEVFSIIAPELASLCFDAYQRQYPSASAEVILYDGARDLILAVLDAGRKPSLVTNKGLARTLIDLDRAGIDLASFTAVVTAEDTADRKPHPAPILLGLQRAKAAAADAVYIGDAPHDVAAAQAAGTRSIAVTYGFYSRAEMSAVGADLVVHDIPELASALGLDVKASAP